MLQTGRKCKAWTGWGKEYCRNSTGQGSKKGLIKFSGRGSKRDNSKITVKTSQKDPTQQGGQAKGHTSAWERQTDGKKDNKLRQHNAGHYGTHKHRARQRQSRTERERDRLHCKSVWQRIARSPGDCVIYEQADQDQHVSTGSCPDHPSLNWTWSNPLAALTAPRQCSASFASPFNNEFMRHGE